MKTNETASLNAQLMALLEASNKEVNVEIGMEDFRNLKNANYSLCFAKKVLNQYNVVWKSSSNFLMMNTFSWTPLYQLFATNVFKDGLSVRANTRYQNCGLGQTCTLDAYGNLNAAVDGGMPTALHFKNEYGMIRPAVNQMVTDIDGRKESLPIYVNYNSVPVGITALTPQESVIIWFEQNIETSTMFSTARRNCIEVDLTNKNSVSVYFANNNWQIS